MANKIELKAQLDTLDWILNKLHGYDIQNKVVDDIEQMKKDTEERLSKLQGK